MRDITSALFSEYIIDGVSKELIPAAMLSEISHKSPYSHDVYLPVVDENTDPEPTPLELSFEKFDYYLAKVLKSPRKHFPLAFSASYTKNMVARALIDAIWKEGEFKLGDLCIEANWSWNASKVGNMSAFYASVEALSDYLNSLDLHLDSYSYKESDEIDLNLHIALASNMDNYDDVLGELPYHSQNPILGQNNAKPSSFVDDPKSWIIYIPFETCDFRLGSSHLADALNVSGNLAPEIADADYFIDCYEVVREMVEDGIILSGATVGDGGLITALKRMSGDKGIDIDIADLIKSYNEKDIIKLLFSEIPGVIIQISDIDYDYIDAELLLQDVVFFPLGHPGNTTKDINISSEGKSDIGAILESLIRSQSSEGED